MAWAAQDLIRRFTELSVIVLGDVMLDRYILGRARRISPEAPVPVVDVERVYERPGGAANVAANVRKLGARTALIGRVGTDADGDSLQRAVFGSGVLTTFLIANDLPTTVKTRVVAQGQQIVRVDREANEVLDQPTTDQMLQHFAKADHPDVVILSDYAKGVLSPTICRCVIDWCRHAQTPVIVDPKGSDYRRYHGATAITPNQNELLQALGEHDFTDDLVPRAQRFFLEELAMSAAVITLGDRGLTLLLPNCPPAVFAATARDVADVTGAGDTVASVFALCVAAGAPFRDAAQIANAAAGLAVGKAGAVALSPDELSAVLPGHVTIRSRRSR